MRKVKLQKKNYSFAELKGHLATGHSQIQPPGNPKTQESEKGLQQCWKLILGGSRRIGSARR